MAIAAIAVLAVGTAVTGFAFAVVNGWFAVERFVPGSSALIGIAPLEGKTVTASGYLPAHVFQPLFDSRFTHLRRFMATAPAPVIVTTDGWSGRARMEVVAGDYFSLLGVVPVAGRLLSRQDDEAAAGTPLVVGERFWRRRLGGDPSVIGATLRVSNVVGTVIGVAPASVRGFSVPSATTVDLFAPIAAMSGVFATNGVVQAQVFGELAAGSSIVQAAQELGQSGVSWGEPAGANRLTAVSLRDAVLPARPRAALVMMSGGVVLCSALLLLMWCANLANLQLARVASRSHETAVRLALGASTADIVRQFVSESACLAAIGCSAGYLLVLALGRVVGSFHIDVYGGAGAGEAVADVGLTLYFVGAAVCATAAIGVLPALRAGRTDPASALAASGMSGRGTRGSSGQSASLVALQVALTTVLTIQGGLFLRSASRAEAPSSGASAGLVLGSVDLANSAWDAARTSEAQARILDIAHSVPGVRAASLSTGLPIAGDGMLFGLVPYPAGVDQASAPCRALLVSPSFVASAGAPLVSGRTFGALDSATGQRSAIVSATAARLLSSSHGDEANVIGRTFKVRGDQPVAIVGVVADANDTARDVASRCLVLLPLSQMPARRFDVVVAGQASDAGLGGRLQAALRAGMTDVSMFDVRTAAEQVARTQGPARLASRTLMSLGAAGLLLAIVGIYSIVAYAIDVRRTEMGVRKALGATNVQILCLAAAQAVRMVFAGVLAGCAAAVAVGYFSGSALTNVSPLDPLTYLAAGALVSVAGLGAAAWPSIKVARISLTSTLLKG